MKITLIADAFLPYISGVTTHNIEFAKHALALGHEVQLFIPRRRDVAIPKELENADIVTMRSAPTPYPQLRINYPNTPKVLLNLQRFEPDIIWCNAASFTGIDAVMASKVLQIPTVATFHTLYTTDEYLKMLFKINRTKILEKTSWAYHRWFYNACDYIFVSTNGMRQYLLEHGINGGKVYISPILFNDSVIDISTAQKAALKKKYGLKKQVAVYLGRISQEKALDSLLLVWKKVQEQNKNSTLLIIGGGKYEDTLASLISEHGLMDSVVTTGFIENELLMSSGLLHVADCYITLSTSETWGVATLEAMAHGLPVILAKSLGVSEVLDGAGFIHEKDDTDAFVASLEKVFSDKQLHDQMGEKARAIAQQYSGKVGTQMILKQFEDLLNPKS